jgi:Fe-S-cluster-containing hydrogenase component 2/bacterioferritin-associated ferredoxin
VFDTVLIAVGLSPVDEIYHKAREFGFDVYSAGDAQEIAEASSAMFSGKIAAMNILRDIGKEKGKIPKDWLEKAKILKSPPGELKKRTEMKKKMKVYPVFHCTQEIPCNPCTSVCPQDGITIADGSITGLPYYTGKEECKGCMQCVAVCPGLAVTLVDTRKDPKNPMVTLPFEVGEQFIEKGSKVQVTDCYGDILATVPVERVSRLKAYKETKLVQVKLSKKIADRVVGIKLQNPKVVEASKLYFSDDLPDDAIICRCERVTAGEIREWIRKGIRDLNQLKAVSRAGMGACGSKTCRDLIYRLFREEGIAFDEVTDRIDRPLFIEVPLGTFAGVDQNTKKGGD